MQNKNYPKTFWAYYQKCTDTHFVVAILIPKNKVRETNRNPGLTLMVKLIILLVFFIIRSEEISFPINHKKNFYIVLFGK